VLLGTHGNTLKHGENINICFSKALLSPKKEEEEPFVVHIVQPSNWLCENSDSIIV
jgi:hypothetical protein